MLFNMLLNYNFMLNDFGSNFDSEKKLKLVSQLQAQVEVGNHNVLTKRVLVSIQNLFTETDPYTLIGNFKKLLREIKKPNSGIANPSYIQILLKYFIVTSLRASDMEEAANLSYELLNVDVKAYFGHM